MIGGLARAVTLSLCLSGAGLGVGQSGPAMHDPVAIFDVGDAVVRGRVAEGLSDAGLVALDAGLVDAAARGAGYDGSVNLTLTETRRLARTVGAPALVFGMTSLVQRESDNGTIIWDAFVALFLADGGSGKLLRYKGFQAAGPNRAAARAAVVGELGGVLATWGDVWRGAARARERGAVDVVWEPDAVDFVDEGGIEPDLIPPRFFKRPVPGYTAEADRAHAVATVDLLVQFNADGSFGPIEVLRWAGFGLDESAAEAVRSCRFFPARRAGRPVTARALLRYNFRFRDR